MGSSTLWVLSLLGVAKPCLGLACKTVFGGVAGNTANTSQVSKVPKAPKLSLATAPGVAGNTTGVKVLTQVPFGYASIRLV